MVRSFLACSAQGIPILTFGDYNEEVWAGIGRLCAAVGGMQQGMQTFIFEGHGRQYVAKPMLTNYQTVYCVVIDTQPGEGYGLAAAVIGQAIDYYLKDTVATILTYLERKVDHQQNASTFANRTNDGTISIEDCMSELFHTNYEKDNFTTFEQQFIRRALIGGSDEQLPLLSWFAPLQGCVGVAELYVAEYAVEGGADVSDFIAAAGRMALDVSQVHAQYATEAKDGQKRRELLMTNALRDVTIRFLQGHFALQSKLEAEGQPRSAAASYLETARVANLGDGTAVWICVVSPRFVFVVKTSVPALPAGSTGARCTVRLREAHPIAVREAFTQGCNRLIRALPEYNPEDPPPIVSAEAFAALLAIP